MPKQDREPSPRDSFLSQEDRTNELRGGSYDNDPETTRRIRKILGSSSVSISEASSDNDHKAQIEINRRGKEAALNMLRDAVQRQR